MVITSSRDRQGKDSFLFSVLPVAKGSAGRFKKKRFFRASRGEACVRLLDRAEAPSPTGVSWRASFAGPAGAIGGLDRAARPTCCGDRPCLGRRPATGHAGGPRPYLLTVAPTLPLEERLAAVARRFLFFCPLPSMA